MKKQIVLISISIFVIVIGVTIYFVVLQKKETKSDLKISTSKPHQHEGPEGNIVEHTHTYHLTSDEGVFKPHSSDIISEKHPMLRQWKDLDLAAIRKNYQPFTVSEMIEKWDEKYEFYEGGGALAASVESLNPKNEWLEHLRNWGNPFLDFGHYKMAVSKRYGMLWAKRDFDKLGGRANVLSGYRLPSDATWEELEEVIIKYFIVARIYNQRARDANPSFAGGVTNLDGVFTPFSEKTVNVYISEDKRISKFTGVQLTRKQKNKLTMYGIAPKGITVVYTDEKGNPLPTSNSLPRFYERRMKALEEAQANVKKMIADHETFINSIPEQTQQVVPDKIAPVQQQDKHPPTHTHPDDQLNTQETVKSPRDSEPKRQFSPEILPLEPPGPHNIQQWFEMLQIIHGGELPNDLKDLQEVIKELEAIRKIGREMVPQRPPLPPERPTPPNNKSSEQ